MKIRICDQICDMPLRCFEFSPTAKEMKYNTCVRQSSGAVQSIRGADTSPVGQNHIKQLTDIVGIKDSTDIVSSYQQNNKQQIFINF